MYLSDCMSLAKFRFKAHHFFINLSHYIVPGFTSAQTSLVSSCTCAYCFLASCGFMCSISLIINSDDEGCGEITEIKCQVGCHSNRCLFVMIIRSNVWTIGIHHFFLVAFCFCFFNQRTCVKFWHLLQRAAPPHWQLSVQGGAAGDVSTPGQTLNLHFQDGRGAEEGKCHWRGRNENFAGGIARMVREMPSRSFTRVRHGSACLCRQWRRSAAKRKKNSWNSSKQQLISFPPLSNRHLEPVAGLWRDRSCFRF